MAVFCTVKRQMQNLATAVFKAFTPPHSYTSDCPKHQQSGTEDSLACIVPFITMIRSWLHTEKKKKKSKARTKISETAILSFLLRYSALVSYHCPSFSQNNKYKSKLTMEASFIFTIFPQHVLNNSFCNKYFHCCLHFYWFLCCGGCSEWSSLTCFFYDLRVFCWTESSNTANDSTFLNQAEHTSSSLSL